MKILVVAMIFGLSGMAEAADLASCETSIKGLPQQCFYDPELPAVKQSKSMRERLFGGRGIITCPGLVTLRALTPELSDPDRGPFCLQWDRQADTYIGYDLGPRDAWMSCKATGTRFCERVNKSKDAAGRMTAAAKDYAWGAESELVKTPSGMSVLRGTGAMVGERLVALGSTAAVGVTGTAALGALAVTAVAVGGAVYVCSDDGAQGAAVEAAPAKETGDASN